MEDGVTNGFHVQAVLEREVGEEFIAGIGVNIGRGGAGVGFGEQDLAVEFLQAPAAGDEAGGELIEQFGMGGPVAHTTEIRGRADDAFAEMMLPDAVDDDAGGERVIDDRVRQLGAAGALFIGFRLALAKGLEEAARGKFAGSFGIAAKSDLYVGGLVGVLHGMKERVHGWEFRFGRSDLGAEFLHIVPGDPAEEAIKALRIVKIDAAGGFVAVGDIRLIGEFAPLIKLQDGEGNDVGILPGIFVLLPLAATEGDVVFVVDFFGVVEQLQDEPLVFFGFGFDLGLLRVGLEEVVPSL